MKLGSHRFAAAWPLLGALALAACSAAPERGAVASSGSELASAAENLAVALADADAAYAANDRVQLAAALQRFDALGGAQLDGDDSELRHWRQVASQTAPMRGRTLGPGYRSGQLPGGASEDIEQVFLSGQRASVAVSGPRGVRLALQVQDRREAAVCGREGNPSHCQWVPTFTDRYRIRIGNPGSAAVKYYLVVQ